MPALHMFAGATYLLQIFASSFLAILFLQSGIDKIVGRRGNLEWLTGHFSKSPLASLVPLSLLIVTALEIAAGLLSATGILQLLIIRNSALAFYGACTAIVAILCLF